MNGKHYTKLMMLNYAVKWVKEIRFSGDFAYNSSRSRFSRRREMVAKNNNGSVANLAPIDLLCSSCGLPSSVLGDLQYHGVKSQFSCKSVKR
jgi:hypothetical protein